MFRASDHEYKARKFHEFCDDKGPTVTIVKANNRIAAVYNCDSWSGKATKDNGIYTMNKEGFIVSIEGEKFSRFRRKLEKESGALSYFYRGPCFGGERTDTKAMRLDLEIIDCCQELGSSSHLGVGYVGTGASPTRLFGTEEFTVQEYEVFGIEME